MATISQETVVLLLAAAEVGIGDLVDHMARCRYGATEFRLLSEDELADFAASVRDAIESTRRQLAVGPGNVAHWLGSDIVDRAGKSLGADETVATDMRANINGAAVRATEEALGFPKGSLRDDSKAGA